jgi:hypothetical protein
MNRGKKKKAILGLEGGREGEKEERRERRGSKLKPEKTK